MLAMLILCALPMTDVPPYQIVESDVDRDYKWRVNVRLDAEVSEAALIAMGTQIRAIDATPYDLVYINYYLPWQEIRQGAWASTHYRPRLQTIVWFRMVREAKANGVDSD